MKAEQGLPFGNERVVYHRSANELLDGLIKLNRPLADVSFKSQSEQFAKTTGMEIGTLSIASQQTSAVRFKTIASPQFTFLLPVCGTGIIKERKKSTNWCAQGNFFSISHHDKLFLEQASTTIVISPKLKNLFSEYQRQQPTFDGLIERLHTSGVTLFASESHRYDYYQMLLRLIVIVDSCGSDPVYLERIGLDGLFNGILATAIVESVAFGSEVNKTLRLFESTRAVDLICSVIQENIGVPLTVARMKSMTGLPSKELNLAFQSRFECSPIEWQRNFLLDQARRYLAKNGETASVSLLARELGFISPLSFLYWYKKRFGVDALSNVAMQVKSASSQLN